MESDGNSEQSVEQPAGDLHEFAAKTAERTLYSNDVKLVCTSALMQRWEFAQR
jgi:hypothetical protein